MRSITAFLAAVAALAPTASAQSCISLSGSTECPAFNQSSISTNSDLKGLYPFLQFVSSREDFDRQLAQYVNSTYVQSKFQNLLGCSNVNLGNTTTYYARYTTSVICNAIVQNSVQPCSLSGSARTPLCADACAGFATSEQQIAVNQQLCGTSNSDYLSQIRADFTNCALPSDALTGSCIPAVSNEPRDCGYGPNLGGLCSYCASSSPNATDSCCINSNVTSRCSGVTFPSYVSQLPAIITATATATATPSGGAAAASNNTNKGLSGGAIAGIVIGSIVGGILLASLIALAIICFRRRQRSVKGSIFNQPSPPRSGAGPPMAFVAGATSSPRRQQQQQQPGRVTRLAALEGQRDPYDLSGKGDSSESDMYERPDTQMSGFLPSVGAAVPAGDGRRAYASQRAGSLSSLAMFEDRDRAATPAGTGLTTENAASGQSEQLPFFKDYYSSDDIHPGDRVAVLWGYQPRAADEFELDRGEMLKVIGIWDDGWATGVRVPDRAEDWRSGKDKARDSGVSNGTRRTPSPVADNDVKAFPLVCVCLPQHWRKTVEGSDTTSPSED